MWLSNRHRNQVIDHNSVGNPRDQVTRCKEFVTVFSSAQGRIFLEYLDLYLMEFVLIKCLVCGKSSSFWWYKRYSAIWSGSREYLEIVVRQNSCTLSGWPRLTAKHSPSVLEN